MQTLHVIQNKLIRIHPKIIIQKHAPLRVHIQQFLPISPLRPVRVKFRTVVRIHRVDEREAIGGEGCGCLVWEDREEDLQNVAAVEGAEEGVP
jgi:hypothetical protein